MTQQLWKLEKKHKFGILKVLRKNNARLTNLILDKVSFIKLATDHTAMVRTPFFYTLRSLEQRKF
jgi:hypothetical protein